jgi:hypothetical protein
MKGPTEANTRSLADAALVVCAFCDAVIDRGHASKRDVETPTGKASVWVCKNCTHLGSEEQTRKYIMKEEKVGR